LVASGESRIEPRTQRSDKPSTERWQSIVKKEKADPSLRGLRSG
jgi:hypothetical protein